jgi:hypothetical protein
MANKYWVVSLPVQNNNSSSSIWNQLQQNISKHSFDTPLYRVTNYLTNHHHHSSLYLLFNWIHRSLLLFITVQYSQSPRRNPRFTPLPQRWSHQGYFRFSFLRFHHINQNRVIHFWMQPTSTTLGTLITDLFAPSINPFVQPLRFWRERFGSRGTHVWSLEASKKWYRFAILSFLILF